MSHENYEVKQTASLAAVTVVAIGLVACTDKGEVTTSEAKSSLTDVFCEVAAEDQAKELLQINPEQISGEACLADDKAGVIGQYIISLNLDGPVTDSAKIAVTLVDEQAAHDSDTMLSFSDLISSVPADDMSQIEIAGKQYDAVYADTGAAVSLGENTLIISIEQSDSANPETGIIPPTLNLAQSIEPVTGNALPYYAGHVAARIEGNG